MSKKICVVRFIINHTLNNGYELINILQPEKLVIRFIAKDVDCLLQIVENMKSIVHITGKYAMQFCFLNAPKSLRENKKLLADIRKIFNSDENIADLVFAVTEHCKTHGNYPNFKLFKVPSEMKKISNFIKSVLNKPNMDDQFVANIVQELIK
jgi:hypothetical protein